MVVTGERDVGRLNRAMERLRSTTGRVASFIGTAIGTGLGAAAAGITAFATGVITTSAKFEQFQAVLEGTEGSAEAARRSMDWVKNFAKTTPYEIEQVMEAFVALKAYGIDPTQGALTSLGNASSGMNKPLMQAIEMLADAQTGEFERLKEFGVRAKVQGNQVAFTYMRAGKEVTVTAKKSSAEIQRALMGIFDQRFAGMMDRQSRTLSGLWSNLKDQLANFQLDIGNAGFFDYVKGELERLLAWVNRLAADGTLKRWAQDISRRLVELAEKLKTIDWGAIWNALKGIGAALLAIGSFFGWVERTFGIFNVAIVAIVGKIAFSLYGLATALGVVSIAGAPLWLVVGVIAAIAAGALLIYRNWDKISAWFTRKWAEIKTAFVNGWNSIWGAMPAWLKGILTGAAFTLKILMNPVGTITNAVSGLFGGGRGGRPPARTVPAPVSVRPRLAPGPAFRPQRTLLDRRPMADSRVRLDVNVRAAPGTQASTGKLASNNRNTTTNVYRGPLAMGA